ncbi:MAG: hypothetical protein ACREFY_15555, partial [Acetobacteraceae bacterium]
IRTGRPARRRAAGDPTRAAASGHDAASGHEKEALPVKLRRLDKRRFPPGYGDWRAFVHDPAVTRG